MTLFRNSLFITLLTPSVFATADIVGFSAGLGIWQSTPDGALGTTSISLDNDLNLQEENANYAFVALEHPVPLLPNIRISYTDLRWMG